MSHFRSKSFAAMLADRYNAAAEESCACTEARFSPFRGFEVLEVESDADGLHEVWRSASEAEVLVATAALVMDCRAEDALAQARDFECDAKEAVAARPVALPVHVLTEARRAMAGEGVSVFASSLDHGIPCCTLVVVGAGFVMNGISGTHVLQVSATDLSRLAAHWRVFRETNLERAAAARALGSAGEGA